jgi:hypothetical protein
MVSKHLHALASLPNAGGVHLVAEASEPIRMHRASAAA